MSSGVHGNRVREPQVVRRSVLPADEKSSTLSGLARAWSSFGEAKNVLQRLESTAACPPTSERPLVNSVLRNHRITKPYTVRFDPKSTKSGENVPLKDTSADSPQMHHGEGSSVDEKENLVEGVVLNDTKELPTGGKREHEGRRETRTGGGASGTQCVALQQVAAGEMNAQTSPIQAALQRAHSAKTDFLSLSPVSNPNTAGSSPHHRAHSEKLHSNANAVFGPPVSFSAWNAQPSAVHPRPPLPGSECPRPALGRPTRKTHSASTHHHHNSVTSQRPPVSAQAPPIRKFELPPDTLTTLRSKIEEQKKAVQATGAKVSALKSQQPSFTTGFYPLPEATGSFTSFSSLLYPHPPPAPPPNCYPSTLTARHRTLEPTGEDYTSRQVKKRKVASAPPPPSYTGFSSLQTGPVHQTVFHPRASQQPYLERAGQAAMGKPLSVRGSKVLYAGRSGTQPTSGGTQRLRQGTSSNQQPTTSTGGITPSSWRTGKELRDRIIRQETQVPKSSPPPQSVSSATKSLPDISSDLSGSSSLASLPPARVISPPTEPQAGRSEATATVNMSASATRPTAGLSSNIAHLLEDLEKSPLERREEDSRADKSKPPLSRPKRYVPGSSSSAPKKPRFNFEPVYPKEKNRHYDKTEVQHYIQHKQEERRKKQQEARSAQEQKRQEREKRLRELYQRQKCSLAANLRQREKEREAYCRALTSSSAAEVHIHIHDSTSSESEMPSNETRRVPAVTLTPPQKSQPTPHTISTPPPVLRCGRETVTTSPKPTAPRPTLSPYHSPIHTPQPRPPSPPTLTGGVSPRTHLVQSHSPASSRTYSVHRTPPSLTPSPKQDLTLPPASAVRAWLSPQADKPSPPPPSGELTSLLRGVNYSKPTNASYRTREERIQALTASALQLKERIAMETKRLTEGAYDGYRHRLSDNCATPPRSQQPFNEEGLTHHTELPGYSYSVTPLRWQQQNNGEELTHRTELPGHSSSVTPPLTRQQDNEEGLTHHTELPGVRNIHVHALHTEQARRETAAALKIQAAYRGYQVRRSLQWRLPSGRTFDSARRGGDGGESESEHGGSEDEEEEEEEEEEEHGSVTPVEAVPPLSVSEPQQATTLPPSLSSSQSCPVIQTSHPLPPWQQGGGDSHSVINVFTRQHEKLRQTLAQLKSQKLAELRQIGEQSQSASSAQVEVLPLDGVTAKGGSHAESPLGIYSYTETFEPFSSQRQEEGSQFSEQFSQDSLGTHSQNYSSAASSPSQTCGESSGSSTPVSRAPQTTQPPTETETTQNVSVFTPPGSPSFVESFSPGSADKPQPTAVRPTASHHQPTSNGRLSPRSLELKLQAELNLLETVEESMRQITDLERTHAVSQAQQETVSVAQLLKSHQQTHEQEVQSLATKAKREVEEAHKQFERVHQEAVCASERIKQMQGEADIHAREHMRKLAQIQEESALVTREASRQLAEARSTATSAAIEAAEQQIQAAHNMAVSVATAAAQEAVKTALSSTIHSDTRHSTERVPWKQLVEGESYHSDFEPSSAHSDSVGDGSRVSHVKVDQSHTPATTPPGHKTGSSASSVKESLTPIATELEQDERGEDADQTLVEEEEEEVEEEEEEGKEEVDGDIYSLSSRAPSPELSFRELLPSESHRRSRRRLSLYSSDSDSRASSPSLSRPRTPASAAGSDLSPFSPSGEDSFFQFMNRMVHAYMREEELRARHQSTLLQLREKALKEKTQAELEWITLKKQQLRSKGSDDLMPPLVSREKGLLKKLHHEQAEIRRLREVQRVASYERRLMLLQQREISKIRRSAQYYQEKIRAYSSRHHDLQQSLSSPCLSLDESHDTQEPEESIHEETPGEHSAAPSPSHAMTFPTYSPSRTSPPEQPVTEDISSHAPLDDSHNTPSTAPNSSFANLELSHERANVSATTPKTPPSDTVTAQRLKKLASEDVKKSLTQREQWLLKRRHMAEEALRQQQELLEREKKLEKEEKQINQLIDKATEAFQHREDMHHKRSRHEQTPEKRSVRKEPSTGGEQGTPEAAVMEDVTSLSEVLQTPDLSEHTPHTSSSIAEEISEENHSPPTPKPSAPSPRSIATTTQILTGYTDDTFESVNGTPSHPPSSHIITSTPVQPPASGGDVSLSDSLKISDSISESMTTSDGSVIEARIRVLKERLRQRKEEVKRVQSEQKKKKKAILRQQEEQLKKRLEAVENKISRTKNASAAVNLSSGTSTSTSQATSTSPTPPPSENGAAISEHPEEEAWVTHTPVEAAGATQEYSHSAHLEKTAASDSAPAVSVAEDLLAKPVKEDLEDLPTPTPSLGKMEEEEEVEEKEEEEEEGKLKVEDENLKVQTTGEASLSIAEELLEKLVDSAMETHAALHNGTTASESSYTETFEKPTDTLSSGGTSLESREADGLLEKPPEEAESHSEEDELESSPSSEHALEEFFPGQQVLVGNKMSGTVRFVGETHFSEGLWIGVELDLPKGRNDGSIDEFRYFSCKPNHGIFAPPSKVSVVIDNLKGEESCGESSVAEEIVSSGSGEPEERRTQEHEKKASLTGIEMEGAGMSGLPHESYTTDFETSTELKQPQDNHPPSVLEPATTEQQQPLVPTSPAEEQQPLVPTSPAEEQQPLVPTSPAEEQQPLVPTSPAEEQQPLVPTFPAEEQQPLVPTSPAEEANKTTEEQLALPTTGEQTCNTKKEQPAEPASSAQETSEAMEQKPALPSNTPVEETFKALEDQPFEPTTLAEEQAPAVISEEDIPEEITEASEATEPSAEHTPLEPLPARTVEMAELSIEKPDSLQLTVEANQRSASVTPVPAPPPEFAEEASHEFLQEPPGIESHSSIADELAQELSNEAIETMIHLWRNKQPVQRQTELVQKDKEVPLDLEEKADRITDQILALLLQTETNLIHNIHTAKKSQTPSPEPARLDPVSPRKRDTLQPLTQLTISTHTCGAESSPPPLSPPSPYHSSPSGEYSPPGSPPRHLSQPSAARVAAGEKSPFVSGHLESGSATTPRNVSPGTPTLEHSTSTESISQLLDSLKVTTAQCMVPSERECVDQVVKHAWNAVMNVGLEHIHSATFECHQEVLSLFSDVREMTQEEDQCRVAYLKLVYMLATETIRELHPVQEPMPVWVKQCTVGRLVSPQQKEITLELVQRKVYAALMRGQLPPQLPVVRFLHGLKRPGGKEIDFVDSILIKELREEEPSWVDYSQDEVAVKIKTADAILDSLLSETAQILSTIEQKRRTQLT